MTEISRLDDPSVVEAEYANPDRQRSREQLLHQVGEHDLDGVLERLVLDGSPASLLDLGCGEGELAARFAALGLSVRGVDVAPAMVAAAQARGVDAQVGDVASLPFPDGAFDRVLARYVLYHVSSHDLERAVQEVARILAPGGRFVAATVGQAFMDSVARHLGVSDSPKLSFSLENGSDLLRGRFQKVDREVVEVDLHFDNHTDLRDYLRGTVSWGQVADRLPLSGEAVDLQNPIAVFAADK